MIRNPISEWREAKRFKADEQEVDAVVAGLQFQEPVIDYPAPPCYEGRMTIGEYGREETAYKQLRSEAGRNIDESWVVLTAVTKRVLDSEPEVRQTLVQFAATPVNEGLPGAVAQALGGRSRRVAAVLSHSKDTLGVTLGLPEIPSERIPHDLVKFEPLYTLNTARNDLLRKKRYGNPEWYQEFRDDQIHTEIAAPGITIAERDLLWQRFRFARDVKLLAVGAELHDNPFTPKPSGESLVGDTLPSGTKIVMDAAAYAEYPQLLDPMRWQKRVSLKDRVSVITVDDKEFIVKERKTNRHTDVKERGHVDGRTSAEEFAIGRHFASLPPIEDASTKAKLVFEKPLGYVETPDGFQFCVFEKQDGLITNTNADVSSQLETAIADNRQCYNSDFIATSKGGARVLYDRPDLFDGPNYDTDDRRVPRDRLTFDEYAAVKARQYTRSLKQLLRTTLLQNGYRNSDQDGFGFQIEQTEAGPAITMVGFDYEYYEHRPRIAAECLNDDKEWLTSGDASPLSHMRVSGHRDIRRAAEGWLFEQSGMMMPPKPSRVTK